MMAANPSSMLHFSRYKRSRSGITKAKVLPEPVYVLQEQITVTENFIGFENIVLPSLPLKYLFQLKHEELQQIEYQLA